MRIKKATWVKSVLIVPFRVFGYRRRSPRCRHRDAVLLPDWLLVQSLKPVEVAPLWVRCLRLAVGPFLGFAVFPQQVRPKSFRIQPILSSSLASAWSLERRNLVNFAEAKLTPLMGFHSPQRSRQSKVRFSRACLARHVPPPGFDYPLDGLLPSIPCRSYFVPAALTGFSLRSFLLPIGIRSFRIG